MRPRSTQVQNRGDDEQDGQRSRDPVARRRRFFSTSPLGATMLAWNVARLVELSRKLTVRAVPLDGWNASGEQGCGLTKGCSLQSGPTINAAAWLSVDFAAEL